MPEDLVERVAALEAKVSRLFDIVGQVEPADGAPTRTAGTTNNFPPEVVELVLAGKKIQAIKELRDRTGLGLAEAKAVVDSIR